MVETRLVRARGEAGAPLRHLDLEVLRAALSRMLRQEWEDAYLIYQLVLEGTEPAEVAAERGVNRLMLTERLRDALDRLARQYETSPQLRRPCENGDAAGETGQEG